MTRKLAFVGNCQLLALMRAYERCCPEDRKAVVRYIPNYQSPSPADREFLDQAEQAVVQVMDFAPSANFVNPRARAIYIPLVCAPFLWPLSGIAHAKNRSYDFLQDGPFPQELGDRYLNARLEHLSDIEAEVENYMRLDVVNLAHAHRMMELSLDRLRQRDELCGTNCATLVERNFRDHRLFRTPNHLEWPLTAYLCRQMFRKLDIDELVLDSVRKDDMNDLYPISEAPVHPSLIKAFNLKFVTENTTYNILYDGKFSVAEYAEKYLRYDWCVAITQALHDVWSGYETRGRTLLLNCIDGAPRSVIARAVLAELLDRDGNFSKAAVYWKQAATLDHENRNFLSKIIEHFEFYRSE